MISKIISILCIGFIAFSASHEFGAEDAKKYLSQFGYMKKSSIQGLSGLTDSISQEKNLNEALAKFQEYFNLKVTGKLNTETVRMMQTPRCGFTDMKNPGAPKSNSIIQNFMLIGEKFEKKNIRYKFMRYTRKLSKAVVEKTIRKAFGVWSAVVPLDFTQTKSDKADIFIGFYSQQHLIPAGTTCVDFDGNSRVLAHAIPPIQGQIQFLHFDDAENWTVGKNFSGIDLFQVAVHEIGHNLGLGHSNVTGAIMFPSYNFNPNFKLDSDDIEGIQSRYGPRKTPQAPRAPQAPQAP